MILIAENINVMSQTIGPALKERRAEPIQALAKAETEAGVQYLDLNIGPSKKFGHELMPWLVDIVQGVSDLPLSLDTTNVVAIEEGLKRCKKPALINSISLQPDRMEQELAPLREVQGRDDRPPLGRRRHAPGCQRALHAHGGSGL